MVRNIVDRCAVITCYAVVIPLAVGGSQVVNADLQD